MATKLLKGPPREGPAPAGAQDSPKTSAVTNLGQHSAPATAHPRFCASFPRVGTLTAQVEGPEAAFSHLQSLATRQPARAALAACPCGRRGGRAHREERAARCCTAGGTFHVGILRLPLSERTTAPSHLPGSSQLCLAARRQLCSGGMHAAPALT